MFDEREQGKQDEIAELLEELTLSEAPTTEASAALRDERLSVDLGGRIRPADRSRQRDDVDIRLVRISPREFSIELHEPLLVGDHYALSFAADELVFGNDEHAKMRCTMCAETENGGFRATMRPFVDIDLRRALSGERNR